MESGTPKSVSLGLFLILAGFLAACVFWRVADPLFGIRSESGMKLSSEPVQFLLKAFLSAVLVAAPAVFLSRQGKKGLAASLAGLFGVLCVAAGQLFIYSNMLNPETDQPMGFSQGISELLWDLSFKGSPSTLYGGAFLVGALSAVGTWLAGKRLPSG
ncbi:MAG: hypothetical protein AB1405_11425 [Bdellovibrionota bacterium]